MFDRVKIRKMSANTAKELARLHPFSSLVNFLYGGNSQGQSEFLLSREFGRAPKEALRKSMMFTYLFPRKESRQANIYVLIQEQRTRQKFRQLLKLFSHLQ